MDDKEIDEDEERLKDARKNHICAEDMKPTEPEKKPESDRVCPCPELVTTDDMTCETKECPSSGTPKPGDIPEEPKVEPPARGRVRFLELGANIWRNFKKNRQPSVGDVSMFSEGLGKITKVDAEGSGVARIYYELLELRAEPFIRCPWCNEAMDYRGNTTNQAEVVVFTCKDCMVEVTVHEPSDDRDMADFLNEYYPDEVEEERDDS